MTDQQEGRSGSLRIAETTPGDVLTTEEQEEQERVRVQGEDHAD
jgi:hypothetical protein